MENRMEDEMATRNIGVMYMLLFHDDCFMTGPP